MNKDAKNAVIEGVQMILRVSVLAVIPVAVTQLQSGTFDRKVVWTTFAIAVLTGIERAFYIYGEETKNMNPVSEVLKFQLK